MKLLIKKVHLKTQHAEFSGNNNENHLVLQSDTETDREILCGNYDS